MKRNKDFFKLLFVNILIVTLGSGALSVRAEPGDYEDPYTEESYYQEDPYSYTEPESSSEYEYSGEESYEYSEPDYTESSDEPYYTESSEEPYVYSEPDYTESSQEESSYYYEPSEYSDPYSQESSSYYEESHEYEYSYQDSDAQNTSNEISGYEYSDNSTLTSEDWEKLKQSNTSHFDVSIRTYSGGDEAIKKIKEDSNSVSNDDWIYLIWGIVLIVVGVAAILVVIFTSIYSKNKLKKNSSSYNDEVPGSRKPPQPRAKKTAPKPEDKPSPTQVNGENEDSIDIYSNSAPDKSKDDYDDFFDQT